MVIQFYSQANLPFTGVAVNPVFFGAQTSASAPQAQQVQVTLPPYKTTVQPPPFQTTINGQSITVNPPPVEVTVAIPAQTVTVNKPGSSTTRNLYESVGVVAGSPPKLCALVRPNVVAAAKHYALNPGDRISFYSPTGIETATVKSVALTFGDLELYYLSAPIASVSPALLTSSLALTDYTSRGAVSFGLVGSRTQAPYNWTPAATSSSIARAIAGTGGVWDATISPLPAGSYMEYGDSGAPNFILLGGQAYFIGSNRKVGSALDVNMVSPVIPKINSL